MKPLIEEAITFRELADDVMGLLDARIRRWDDEKTADPWDLKPDAYLEAYRSLRLRIFGEIKEIPPRPGKAPEPKKKAPPKGSPRPRPECKPRPLFTMFVDQPSPKEVAEE